MLAPPGSPPSTREAILLEAAACFAEHGYEGTSLNDIATRVGIRKPSLLHHFPSKDALYAEVFERYLSDWFERLETAQVLDGEGWDRIVSVLDAGFRFFAANPGFVRLMRREAIDGGAHLGVDLAAVLRPQFERAVAWMQHEMDAGRFRVQDPRQAIITGYGALLTYFSDAPFIEGLIDADPFDPEVLQARLDHVVAYVRAALLP